MRHDRTPARRSARRDLGALYRVACTVGAATALFVACGIDPSDDIGHAEGALELPPLPADAFTDVVVPTEGATGWTAGTSSVTDDGAAVFDIPLHVPVGRHGIQPDLSLHYHSRAGDGLLGAGWTLSGLSMITRCARNLLVDGFNRDVQFTSEDGFCIDGERLVEAPTEGFWGGGQYRKWRNGFERIELTGQPGDPASVFRVWHSDGTIWTYGGASDGYISGPRIPVSSTTGRPLSPTTETYGWLLTRVQDRFGNYMQYHYTSTVHADGTVEVLPSYIDYTHHPAHEKGQRRVSFSYQPRPTAGDTAVVQWISGFGLRTTQLLSGVLMSAPGGDVRRYELTYARPPNLRGYQLRLISECDGSGVCREPLVFSYTKPDRPLDARMPDLWTAIPTPLEVRSAGIGAPNADPSSPTLTQYAFNLRS